MKFGHVQYMQNSIYFKTKNLSITTFLLHAGKIES